MVESGVEHSPIAAVSFPRNSVDWYRNPWAAKSSWIVLALVLPVVYCHLSNPRVWRFVIPNHLNDRFWARSKRTHMLQLQKGRFEWNHSILEWEVCLLLLTLYCADCFFMPFFGSPFNSLNGKYGRRSVSRNCTRKAISFNSMFK